MNIEPAVIWGFIGSVVVAVLEASLGNGWAWNAQSIITVATPLVIGFITRMFVTPVGRHA